MRRATIRAVANTGPSLSAPVTGTRRYLYIVAAPRDAP
jgi:hypothetical protein